MGNMAVDMGRAVAVDTGVDAAAAVESAFGVETSLMVDMAVDEKISAMPAWVGNAGQQQSVPCKSNSSIVREGLDNR